MPLRQVSSHHSKRPTSWFTDHISELISLKNKVKHKANGFGDPVDETLYSQMKNHLKVAIRQAKLTYLESLMSQNWRMPSCAVEVWNYVC